MEGKEPWLDNDMNNANDFNNYDNHRYENNNNFHIITYSRKLNIMETCNK